MVLQPTQHALVTGASSGIGRAIALALAAEGLRLILVGRDSNRLSEVAAEAGSAARAIATDLATETGIAKVSLALGPRLHVLVHSAGIHLGQSVTAQEYADWRNMDAINLYAPMRLTAACLDRLELGRGQIVMVNSTAALAPPTSASLYAAGKQALKVATDALRQEVNVRGIRVLSLYPGRTDTPMQAGILAAEQRSAPPGTLMRPEDVAQMVVAALKLPPTAEVTDIIIRPTRPLSSFLLDSHQEGR